MYVFAKFVDDLPQFVSRYLNIEIYALLGNKNSTLRSTKFYNDINRIICGFPTCNSLVDLYFIHFGINIMAINLAKSRWLLSIGILFSNCGFGRWSLSKLYTFWVYQIHITEIGEQHR